MDAASVVVFEVLDRLVDIIVFNDMGVPTDRLKSETADMICAYLFHQ
ncbi:hypothetical protein J2T12_005313 [Paenibacillus anaericanus]|nr:hypothetical protein [Paenibacillus anaericanus]MDQ0091870.1 hypothetical protein [Paenibacillus anaericanus]